ncbi:MAG: HAD hydrolase-like protein, partial [Clostridia bacterium]
PGAVMIGDRKFDILAGQKVGLKTFGAGYGYAQGDELIRAGADIIAKTPAEIGEILLHGKN